MARRRPPTRDAATIDRAQAERSDLAERVAEAVAAVAGLSPRLREASRLVYLAGHRQAEVARRLGVPVGTVKSRLANSRKLIRERMDAMSNSDHSRIVPPIDVEEIRGAAMRVPLRGYGLAYGSVLEVGDVETMGFYDYPGGVLTSVTRTQVRRRVELCGRPCFEVLVTNNECEPAEPAALEFFEVSEQGTRWLLRVRQGEASPNACPEVSSEPLAPVAYDTAEPTPNINMRVVNLRVGQIDRGRCLAVLEWDEDGTAVEMFFQPDGRCVLHRRYVGPDARYGDYAHLPEDNPRAIQSKAFRHWYDTLLLTP